jgi:hypothetical protein
MTPHLNAADYASTGFGFGLPLLGAIDAAQQPAPAMPPMAYVLLSVLVPLITQAGLAARSAIASWREVKLAEAQARRAEAMARTAGPKA